MPTKEQVLATLREVTDPELGASLVDMGMIRQVQVEEDCIHVRMVLTIPGCPLARYLLTQVENKVKTVAEGRAVDVKLLDEPWDPTSMFVREPGNSDG